MFPNHHSGLNVSDHETVHVGRTVTLESVRETEPLQLSVIGEDCDGDFPLPIIYFDRWGLAPDLGEVDCKFEEEIWEFSGANDVQVTDLTLSPQQWIKGGTYTSGRTGPTLNSIMHVTVVPGP